MNTETKAPDSAAIYGNYRAKMKALRIAGPHRAGERKQLARQAVSSRYGVPHKVIKSIVAEYDQLNGVTHEHDVNYLKEIEFDKAAQVLLAAHGDNPMCPHCGEIPAEECNSVRVRVNPFEAEIHNELQPLLSCFHCYHLNELDI